MKPITTSYMKACKWVVSSTDSYGQNNSFYVCCHLCRMHDKAKWRNRDRIKKKNSQRYRWERKKAKKKTESTTLDSKQKEINNITEFTIDNSPLCFCLIFFFSFYFLFFLFIPLTLCVFLSFILMWFQSVSVI